MKLTKEQLQKARAAKSVDELTLLAKENGIEMSMENIKAQFDTLHGNGALSDEELGNVSGGCGDDEDEPVPAPAPAPTPVTVGRDDVCEHFSERFGAAGGEYLKFYTGRHCESCYYFQTSPTTDTLDPYYNGIGYCFYGIKTHS